MLTGQHDRENAIKAVGLGAYDFFAKPFRARAAQSHHRARLPHARPAEGKPPASPRFEGSPLSGLLTRDPGMLKVCRTIEARLGLRHGRAARRERCRQGDPRARPAHVAARASERFVAINCAAIPDALLERAVRLREGRLHRRSETDPPGKIRTANGGTLFLDEIGDLPLALQAKLLRFLQERSIERIGGREEIPVDVRIVCHPSQPQGADPGRGLPRGPVLSACRDRHRNPALRERDGDATYLAHAFAQRFARRTAGARPSSRTTPSRRSRRTAGRATCASWKTASSVR